MRRLHSVSIAKAALFILGGFCVLAAPQEAQQTATQTPQSAGQVSEPVRISTSSTVSTTVVDIATTNTPTVGTPVVAPSIITAGGSTPVSVIVQITDPTLIAGSVNLLQLGATGAQPTILGVMQSNGSGIYSLQPTFNESTPGEIQLQVSAAFRGQLRRVASQIATLGVWGVLGDTTSGFKTLYPPVLYDLSSTTTFGGFLLQSSPQGVDIGGEGPENGSNATTRGFSVVITPTPYSTEFDINAWLLAQYPYSYIDTLATTSIGGEQGYEIVFDNEVGAGEPTVVVYHQGYVYTLSYASTFAAGSIADQNGLSIFSEVLQNFGFSQ